MEKKLSTRFKNAINAFRNRDPTIVYRNIGPSYSMRPDRIRLTGGNDKSIITAIFNRIAMDTASLMFRHCRLDEEDRFIEYIEDSLDNCLTLEANIDQTGRAFIQDLVMSMLDEGVVAAVPIDTMDDPWSTESFKILSMRTAKIIEWFPYHLRVNAYNELKGRREDVLTTKSTTAIIENPLYAVINEPNSTVQRLKRKLALLDITDENLAANKLNMIIQLPYVIKTEARKNLAEARRQELEDQLTKSAHGIAYSDGTEKIVQLNRPLENGLLNQVEYLTDTLYSQLGMTKGILEGTASEQEMLNYYSRTIEPIASAIVDEFKRKFLTKTARSQKQTILFFRDPFKLVPINNVAEIADKFTRNEILTSNELRQIIGRKPSKDPKADMLINSNLNHSNEELGDAVPNTENEEEIQNETR